jgi:hypothetical protein
MGFAEVSDHEVALQVVRQLNNVHLRKGPGSRGVIIEFALDNAKALQKREHKKEKVIKEKEKVRKEEK